MAFSAGVLDNGYTGEVGRTWPVGEPSGAADLYRRWDALWHRLYDACRPGAPGTDLLAAYQAAGEQLPPMPIARGLGLGFDPPVVSQHLPATAAGERLEAGMVLAVTGYVWQEGRWRGVWARGGVDHDRWPRNPDIEPVGQRRCRRLKMAENERPSPEEIILYAKDPKTKIATITFNRPEFLNAPTAAARLRYADLLHAAGVDDDVKVVVIRGVGDDFGSGADLPEFMEGADSPGFRLAELRLDERRYSVSTEGIVSPRRNDRRMVRECAGRQPLAAGVQKDQHRRGQGVLLRLALLSGR